jgi:hypothetical protein
MFDERENKEKAEVVEDLKKQIQIEGKLVGLYENREKETENLVMKRVMQMFRLDSQRHINILQAAVEIIEGEEVFIQDRKPLAETFKKHLELEEEALKKANRILNITWVEESKGLKNLIQLWRDDEKRHHNALKTITRKPYIRLDSNDFVVMFREEEFLEERYKRSKEFREKQDRAKNDT